MTNNKFFFTKVANQIRPLVGLAVLKAKSLRTYYLQGGTVYGKKPKGFNGTTVRAASLAEAQGMAA
jgi:hypothetical protein